MSWDMNGKRGKHLAWSLTLGFAALSIGCSATPVGMAMHMAGEAVNDVDEQEKTKQYVGAPVSDADAKLGAPIDILADTKSSRRWRTYAVPMDPLGNSRYVIEVHNGKIIALHKVQRYSDPVEYAAVLAVLEPKAMGKSPAACEANLDMGAPRLTVRGEKSGTMIQLYDARVVKDLQRPHYCVLRFGRSGLCEKMDLVKAYTASGEDPTQQ